MSLIIKYKKYLLVFLLNFAMFFGLFLCEVRHSSSSFLSFVVLWIISFVFINFIIFCLFEIIKKERRVFLKNKQDFSLKMNECLDRMSNHYNIIEISKISFGIYHDLANILTILGLSLEQLKSKSFILNSEGKRGEDGFNSYNDLINTSTRALSLVSFLKNQYKDKISLYNFEIAEEIKKSLSLFNFYFRKYKIKLKLSLQEEIYLFSDRTKFFQIIMNLTSNAIDSLKLKDKSSSKKFFIKLFKNKDFIYLIFKDNGVGIDPSNLKFIFQPFFSLKSKNNGINCGFGLFSCKKIIENDFLGKIKIKSDLGCGAKFTIKIPLKPV